MSASNLDVSVVIPCLNEEVSLAHCIDRATSAMSDHNLSGEIIVADNGSTDSSVAIAEERGARVVHVAEKGYGSALMGGIEAAQSDYIVMGDADGSYDFGEIPNLVTKLREGFELVQGCRLPSGGGTVLPGAMPFLHRWIGNPLLSFLARMMFKIPVHDIYCGLRGFRASLYRDLGQRCTGMEFAVEMIIKASRMGRAITEIPITLHPDQRKTSRPHLRTFRDGWRTLRFFLISSPRWLYLVPGTACVGVGLLGYALALPALPVFGIIPDVHTLLCSSVLILIGVQAIFFGIFAKTFAITEGLIPDDHSLDAFYRFATLERGLVLGVLLLLIGIVLICVVLLEWYRLDFGRLEYARTMRYVIPGAMLAALSFQTMLSSFGISLLGIDRK